jgi:hypothetical protein
VNPRGKIVAAQAAVVTALVIVVYVTLLRPEGPGEIRGIEAPNGGALPQVDARQRPDRADRSRRTPSRSAAGAVVVAGEGVVAAAGDVPTGGAAAPLITPRDDQYTDAVKALLERVDSAPVPGQ